MKKLVVLALLVLIAAALLVAGGGQPAYAAGFTVDSTADVVDASPGDGVCDDGSGACTLRAAIQEANALASADIITVPAGTYTLSIAGAGEDANASGDLDISDDLTINGAGAASTVIDGGGIDRVLEARPGATVEINGVTVRNGNPGAGGAGGGIVNSGTMTLTNSTVTSSTAGVGGGIYNHGTMTVNSSTVSDNSGAGGVYSSADGLGGGIFNDGTMTVNNSTVNGNTAPGVYWFPPGGGGIFNSGGMMTLTNSTVSGNTAGTGVVNLAGSLTIENSTISGNTGNTGYGGGGVLNFSFGGQATTSVISSTIAENRNLTGRGDAIADAFSPAGSLTVKNSILASPTTGLGSDCYGAVTSLGHNIASDASCGLAGSGDQNSTDPLLGPLADNGGPTQTHALLAGSPAIDTGSGDCPPPATDQRGVARPQGPACDIGAFELEAGLDHFKCYEAGGLRVNVTVSLEDQFGLEPQVPVEEPELFCNPVQKTHAGEITEIGDATAHLTGYEIEAEGEIERQVIVNNQFGEGQSLTVSESELLFVPSEKNGVASALNLDHFQCYEAEGDPVNVTVNLKDQFGDEPGVLVREPELFCNPVDKDGEGIIDPTAHLTCYEIAADEEVEQAVGVNNQFGLQTLEVEKPELLCVPSEKLDAIPLPPGDDDEDEDNDDDGDDD